MESRRCKIARACLRGLFEERLLDPLRHNDHARVLGWATIGEIAQMKTVTHRVNEVLRPLFSNAGIDLVEDKLEFGHPRQDPQGALVLGASSLPMVVGSGTRRPVKHSTRIGSAAISAKASNRQVERRIGSAL